VLAQLTLSLSSPAPLEIGSDSLLSPSDEDRQDDSSTEVKMERSPPISPHSQPAEHDPLAEPMPAVQVDPNGPDETEIYRLEIAILKGQLEDRDARLAQAERDLAARDTELHESECVLERVGLERDLAEEALERCDARLRQAKRAIREREARIRQLEAAVAQLVSGGSG